MATPHNESQGTSPLPTVVLHRFRADAGSAASGAVVAHEEASYLRDLKDGIEAATRAGDFKGARQLLGLHCGYLPDLEAMGTERLVEYLESKRVWRELDDWPVYKTVGEPCIAFTAQVGSTGSSVDVIVLGACYRYPSNSDDVWWRDAIMPRVRAL